MPEALLYRGSIASLDDPQRQGRALTLVQAIRDTPSWARVYLAPLSTSTGAPKEGDIVMVGFEQGSTNHPVVFPLACGEMVTGIKLLRGVVVATQDPMGKGRVQVEVPALLGSRSSTWAIACRMLHRAPASTLPVGTGVVVTHENGNTDYPVVLGLI